jgi:hypothetical protein
MYLCDESNWRLRGESQGDYCKRCVFVAIGGCNVILKDGEICGDRIEDSSIPDGSLPMDENNE